jgi:hypothetical protein
MADALNVTEMKDWTGYLRGCTDSQLREVFKKEVAARRTAYAYLAELEGDRRGISVR